MYKKILVGTCLAEYCSHIFNFALQRAQQNDARLRVYHGLGRLHMTQDGVEEKIKAAELSLYAPCPVMLVPPALIPGLARG